ncbi:MAG TPA: molecular chaperone DnaJ, partial [Acidimicrobiaceae bacterium]|nr:molecular chaperone DnaJ [Acidimicrobiaceae bacterium]
MAPRREWFETDYYATLGVSSTATDKEITKAYRRLARTHHPDGGGDEERFKKIAAAYDVLGAADKRAEYDEVRSLGASASDAGFDGGFASGPGEYSVRVEDIPDLDDLNSIFGNLFAQAGRVGFDDFPRPPRIRGVDLESRLHLGFRDAVKGFTTTVRLAGNFAMKSAARRIKVRIPAGVADGQRIRLAGKGGPGRNGGINGDLYVIVEVAPDHTFGRKGRHLTLTVPVTYPEAVLGTELKVTTFDDSIVTLRVPAGTKSGATFRVKGRGVKSRRSTGDLLVTTEIVVPAKLSRREREAVENLASVTDYEQDEPD